MPDANHQAFSKGKIVLPKEIRSSHAWGPGTEFIVEETREGILLRPSRRLPPTKVEDVAGCLKWRGKPKTIEEMDSAIPRAIARCHARGRY